MTDFKEKMSAKERSIVCRQGTQ